MLEVLVSLKRSERMAGCRRTPIRATCDIPMNLKDIGFLFVPKSKAAGTVASVSVTATVGNAVCACFVILSTFRLDDVHIWFPIFHEGILRGLLSHPLLGLENSSLEGDVFVNVV